MDRCCSDLQSLNLRLFVAFFPPNDDDRAQKCHLSAACCHLQMPNASHSPPHLNESLSKWMDTAAGQSVNSQFPDARMCHLMCWSFEYVLAIVICFFVDGRIFLMVLFFWLNV